MDQAQDFVVPTTKHQMNPPLICALFTRSQVCSQVCSHRGPKAPVDTNLGQTLRIRLEYSTRKEYQRGSEGPR